MRASAGLSRFINTGQAFLPTDADGRPRYQWMVHTDHFQQAWKTLAARLSLVGTEVERKSVV